MERCMPKGAHTGKKFDNVSYNDCVIDGEFANCDFSQVAMTRVELKGTFIDCNFAPTEGVKRQLNDWGGGTFIRCKGLGR